MQTAAAAPVQRKWTREHAPEKRREVVKAYMKQANLDIQRLVRGLGCQVALILVDQDPEIGRSGVVHGTYTCATPALRWVLSQTHDKTSDSVPAPPAVSFILLRAGQPGVVNKALLPSCRPLFEEHGVKELAKHLSAEHILKTGLQRDISARVTQYLPSLPLKEQRSLVQALWSTAMYRQQQLVKFNSSIESVRSHYPGYPLDSFRPPRKLSAEELAQLLPYLVNRAGTLRQYQVEVKLHQFVSHAFTQDAMNILATAFRETSQAAGPAGKLFALPACWQEGTGVHLLPQWVQVAKTSRLQGRVVTTLSPGALGANAA